MATTLLRCRDLAAAISALATAAAVHAQPRVIYTDASNLGAHNGASWQTAFRDLQDALTVARSAPERLTGGIEIHIAQGIYTPDRGTGDRNASFLLNSAVTLMGGFAGLLGGNPDERDPKRFVSVLSGDLSRNDGPSFTNDSENSRTIVLTPGAEISTTLDGLEISGGNSDSNGAGVLSTRAYSGNTTIGHITIRNCTITRNRAVSGPVLNIWQSRLSNCRIVGNRADGNAIVRGSGSTFEFCVVRNNRLVNQSVFQIVKYFSVGDTDRFTRCLIADNLSGGGGAISAYESGMNIDIAGCTIANNSGVGVEAIWSSYGSVKLRNTIVSRNVLSPLPSAQTQIIVRTPALLDVDGSVLIDNGASGVRYFAGAPTPLPVMSGDPLFVSPDGPDHDPLTSADNNFHLRPGSPAIDRAHSSLLSPDFTDLDGMPLYDDPNTTNLGSGPFTYADLGCYEFDGHLCPADFNASGSITIADIFDFLNAWLASDPRADFDGGGLAVGDIFAFINAWLAGC